MKNEKLTHRPVAKITAFFIMALCIPVFFACVAVAVFLWENNYYGNTHERIVTDMFRSISLSAADDLADLVAREETENDPDDLYAHEAAVHCANAAYRVTDSNRKEVFQSEFYDLWADTPWQFQSTILFQGNPMEYRVSVRIDPGLSENDEYRMVFRVTSLLYGWRYAVYVLAFAVSLLAVIAFIFLMYAAGRRPGKEEPVPGTLSKIPFDLLSVVMGGICLYLIVFLGSIFRGTFPELIVSAAVAETAILLFVFWCMLFAEHIKCGGWWKNTLIYRIWHTVWKALRFCFGTAFRWITGIPLVPKTVLIVIGVSFVEFVTQFFFFRFYRNTDARLFCWLLNHAVMGIAIVTIAMQLRRLQKGGEALASGNLSYQTPAEKMLPAFRQHAMNLNSIADGMQTAVAQQMKSERMKTELITNVSHDIKTPLTSIINYIGLLKEEHTAEQEQEYIEVLDRQSHRLKKLTEDLVEASKASSGNMEVHAEKQSMNELLRQALGEHQDRLDQIPLETIVSMPGETVSVDVDGKLMWRILDNLLNNICKYALPGTRCYVELESADHHATIRMKNISKEQLNISADELTERFVRGDASRGGEGSGLGLHISKSLAELMGGILQVTVDGDLFKTEVAFPITQ